MSFPRDFLDDDEDAYETNVGIDQDELTSLPISLAALDVSTTEFKFCPVDEWKEILQLIDPLQIFHLHTICILALQSTFQYEQKYTAIEKQIKNPPVSIEVLQDSSLADFFRSPMVDVVTSQILPLFRVMLVKSYYKSTQRHVFSLRKGSKVLTINDILALVHDIQTILALPSAVNLSELASRLYLALLATATQLISQDVTSLTPEDAAAASIPFPVDYSPMWFELSEFQIVLLDSSQPAKQPNSAQTPSYTLPEHASPEFIASQQCQSLLSIRNQRLLEYWLTNLVLNYEHKIIAIQLPPIEFALPQTINNNNNNDSIEQCDDLNTDKENDKKSIKNSWSMYYADLAILLPNILTLAINAIIRFYCQYARQHQLKQAVWEQAQQVLATKRQEDENNTILQQDEAPVRPQLASLAPNTLIQDENLGIFATLPSQTLASPAVLLQQWLLLTSKCIESEAHLCDELRDMLVIQDVVQDQNDPKKAQKDDQNNQGDLTQELTQDQQQQQELQEEPTTQQAHQSACDVLALSMSLSLAQSYTMAGFPILARVFFEQQQVYRDQEQNAQK